MTDAAHTAAPPARRSSLLGRIRLGIIYLFLLAVAIFAQPTLGLVAIGLPFVIAGEAVRAWAAGHLLKSKELAVSGPYRYTRNPLYLGRFLILTGLCLMARLPENSLRINLGGILHSIGVHPMIVNIYFPGWTNLILLGLGWAVFFLYYLPRKIRVEGARLRRLHGEACEGWFLSVPLLFPRVTPYGQNVRAWDSSRFLRNREHWMIVGVTIVTALFLYRALTTP